MKLVVVTKMYAYIQKKPKIFIKKNVSFQRQDTGSDRLKISFIGAGRLGSIMAYTTALRGLADEIVLVDIIKELAVGQAKDIQHAAAATSDMRVTSGEYEDMEGSSLVVVSAGRPRGPGMSRLDLLATNAPIMRDIAQKVSKIAPDSVFMTLTNPMDIMNYVAYKYSGFDRTRVIGSGGQLDSLRFRTALAEWCKAPLTKVEGYVLGEHGDTQVPVWSKVKIGGSKRTFTDEEKKKIREQIKEVAIKIIEGKKATEYGPANGTAGMMESIVKNRKWVIPCSLVLQGEYGIDGVSIGVPVALGKNGVVRVEDWKLEDSELQELRKSAAALSASHKEALDILSRT